MKPLTPEDLNGLCSLVDELKAHFPELDTQGFSWTHDSLKNELSVGAGSGLWLDKVLVAFILYRDLGDAVEITLLCTHPRYQRQGHMERLFKEFCQVHAHQDVWLEVHAKNDKALKFYGKIGFKESGRRERYYKDGTAAIMMIYKH